MKRSRFTEEQVVAILRERSAVEAHVLRALGRVTAARHLLTLL